MANPPNYYQILGVDRTASGAQIKNAYRTLARRFHPDLNQSPIAADQFRQVSEAYQVLGDPKQRSDYDYIIADQPADADAKYFYRQGMKQAQQGRYLEAINYYDYAIKADANYADAYNKRGLCHFKLGDPITAIKDYGKALYLDAEIADAYHNRGIARLKLGNTQGAIEDYSEAIRLRHNYGQAFYGRGQAWAELGDQTAAIADLKIAAQIFRNQGDQANYKIAIEFIHKASSSLDLGILFTETLLCLTSSVVNPMRGLRTAYGRLNPSHIIYINGLSALIFIICFGLGNHGIWQQMFGYLQFPLRLMVGTAGVMWLSVVISQILVRLLFRGKGNWIDDMFGAGLALLPLGYLSVILTTLIFLRLANPYLVAGLMVLVGCYVILILYSGCHQVSRISEPWATLAVPMIILTSGLLMALLLPPLMTAALL